jgi:hypothetical protein
LAIDKNAINGSPALERGVEHDLVLLHPALELNTSIGTLMFLWVCVLFNRNQWADATNHAVSLLANLTLISELLRATRDFVCRFHFGHLGLGSLLYLDTLVPGQNDTLKLFIPLRLRHVTDGGSRAANLRLGVVRALDDDRLVLEVVAQAQLALLAAEARVLEAAERRVGLDYRVAVHVHRASAHAVGDLDGVVQVGRHHAGAEAEFGVVGALDDLVDGLELDDRHDGAEDLLAGDGHVLVRKSWAR